MEIDVSYVRYSRNYPTNTRIQLEIKNGGFEIVDIVCNHNGLIDTSFIENLKNIVDILEEQNRDVNEFYKNKR